jgi:anti-anti-sigma factor
MDAAEATFNRQDGQATIVGEIDMGNAGQLREMLAGDVNDILIDCAELTFLDPSGIAVLAFESRRRELAGHRLRVRNVQPNVQRVLEIAGMLDELT